MRASWLIAVALVVLALSAEAKQKKKFEGDFEFVDEVSVCVCLCACGDNCLGLFCIEMLASRRDDFRVSTIRRFLFGWKTMLRINKSVYTLIVADSRF